VTSADPHRTAPTEPPTGDLARPPAPAVDSLAQRLLEARVLQRLVGDATGEIRVDRFVIERELGTGGMGTIYAAWDGQLQRRVALKFLHRSGADPAGEQRLFREAQALARLSHPNVVPVFQVGRHEGRVWLAMEHVAGQTLRAWAQAAPRSRGERLSVWLAAGRGLAAIHAAGLVHRDIKPDNVMIGDDGRVRIVDFGLVRLANAASDATSEAGRSTAAAWADGLTAEDGFVGTPAYAPPEQIEGGVIDARSDQFSFCVSVWEALCGRRPVRARDHDGRPIPPAGVRLPARILRALSRGLSLDPAQRFDDMERLLAMLAPPRRRWLAPSLSAAAAASVGLALGAMLIDDPAAVAVETAPCARAGAEIDEVWAAERMQPLVAALPEAAVARTRALLDGWAADWRQAAREACEDVYVRRHRSPASLDLRGACLDRRLAELGAIAAGIEAGRVGSEHELVAWLGRLEAPRDCLGDAVLTGVASAVPAAQVDEVAQLRRDLIEVQLEGDARSLAARIADAEQLLHRARALGWSPLMGEAALALGRLHTLTGNGTAARLHLGEALDAGDRTRDVELQARAWSALNQVERLVALDVERARWAAQRHAGVLAAVPASPRQRAQLLTDQGLTQELAGAVVDAEASLREALALLEGEGSTAAWRQATVLRGLGNVLAHTGRAAEARALLARARDLELGGGLDGPWDRPAASEAAHRLDEGIAMIAAGDPEAAADHLQRALAAATREHGPRSELVARLHVALTAAYDYLGQNDRVRTHAELADAISLEAVGATHPLRVDVLSAVGVSAYHDGRTAAAVAAFERALQLVRRHKPADSLAVAQAEHNLAEALHRDGRDEHAGPLLDHAILVLEQGLGAEDPRVADARQLHATIRTTQREVPTP
jgi:eukaryotic-like serine/threonine-protein kinase